MNSRVTTIGRNKYYWLSLILFWGLILFLIFCSYLERSERVESNSFIQLATIFLLLILFIVSSFFSKKYIETGAIEFDSNYYVVCRDGAELKINYQNKTKITFIYHNHKDEHIQLRIFFYGNKICDGADNVLKITDRNGTSIFNILIKSDEQRKDLENYLLSLKEKYNLNVEIRQSISRILKVY